MANFRANLNLSSSSNKRYTDEIGFGGVDYANPRFSVASNHALDEKNYLYRDNAVQKRYGVDKLDLTIELDYYCFIYLDPKNDVVIDGSDYTGTSTNYKQVKDKILNIWYFKGFVILNIDGVLFYSSSKENLLQYGNLTPLGEYYKAVTSTDNVTRNAFATMRLSSKGKPLSAFESNGKLYILTGEYMYVLEYKTETLLDEDNEEYENDYFYLYALTEKGEPYIPTTTLGIVQNESTGYATRQTFEQPNLLTPKRKNGCVGGVENADTDTTGLYTYALDTSAKSIDKIEIADTSAIPWSNIGTYSQYDYYNQNTDTGFAFPRLEQSFRCISLDSKSYEIDLSQFKVITKDGKALGKSNKLDYAEIPALHVRTFTDSNQFMVVPSNDLYAAFVDLEGGSGFSKSKAEYEEGKYYVAIIDLGAATTSNCSAESVCMSKWGEYFNEGVTEAKKNQMVYYSLVYPNIYNKYVLQASRYYQILLYAKIDNQIQWGTIFINTFGGKKGFSAREKTSTVDPYDYVGNIPFSTMDGDSVTYAWNLGIAYLTGRMPENVVSLDELYFKVGNWAQTQSSFTLPPLSEEYSEFLTLYTRDYAEAFIDYSKKHGWLAVHNLPFSKNGGCLLVNKQGLKSESPTIYGYATKENGVYNSVVLFEQYKPSVEGDSNITITFTAYGEENNKDDINKCTFGIMYGTQGYKNRLFVSGNADNPTFDWHSADGTDNDLDYFPSDSVCKYGQSGEVTGYGVVSDGKLMVVKKYDGKNPTIYYRTATYTAKTDDYGKALTDNGGNSMYDEVYQLTQTNSHIGAISNRQFTDFNGDSLFVDNDGRIVGLDNEGTTYDNQRVATTRSALIDPKIKPYKSEDNYLVSYGNELFYFCNNKCYYTYFDTNYEWFVLDFGNDIEGNKENVIDSCYIDDELLFITDQGCIFRYNKTFADKLFTSIGTYTIKEVETNLHQIIFKDTTKKLILNGCKYIENINENKYTYREYDGLNSTNKTHKFSKDGFMAYIGADKNIAESYKLNELIMREETDGYYLYEDKTNTGKFSIIPNNAYYIWTHNNQYTGDILVFKEFIRFEAAELTTDEIIKLGSNTRKLKMNAYSGDKANLKIFINNKQQWVLMKRMEDNPTLVYNEKYDSFFICEGTNEYNNIEYENVDVGVTSFGAKITRYEPVYASYITAPYLATSLAYRKALDSYTIMSDTSEENEIYLRMATNEVTLDDVMKKTYNAVGKQVDYSAIDYDYVDYSRYDLPHTQTLLARFYGSFICFSLFSPNAKNSTLTKINYLYHYAGKTYGKN